MKRSDSISRALRHVFSWAFILLFSLVLVNRSGASGPRMALSADLVTWSVYLVVFYVNYLLLMPFLLFRKRTWLYVLVSLLLLALAFGTMRTYHQVMRMSRVREYVSADKRFSAYTDRGKAKLVEIDRRTRDYYGLQNYNPFSWRSLPLLYGILLAFSASMVSGFIRKWKEEEQQRKEAEQEKIVAELEYLKQQINPHFLFNALNSIYSLTIPDSPAASDSILKLSSILRYMLYETDKRSVPLSEEIAVIRDYIALQQLRLTAKTRVSFVVPEGDLSRYRIEPLLLIPFIENAFKYGVDSVEDSFIRIRMEANGDRLLFSTENKVVSGPSKGEEHAGIGIRNIRRRLELLYAERFKLVTRQDESVFYVSLELKPNPL